MSRDLGNHPDLTLGRIVLGPLRAFSPGDPRIAAAHMRGAGVAVDYRESPREEIYPDSVEAEKPILLLMWAIRHRPTGHYLPRPVGRQGKGGSHVEPVQVDEKCPPRLFHSETAARIALRAWLKGRYVRTYSGSAGLHGEDEEEGIEVRPVPGRRAADMEVVPARIVL